MPNNLRKFIIAELVKELDEMSTTGGIAGYTTPHAFQGNSKRKRKMIKPNHEILPFGKKANGSKIEEGSRYNEFKNNSELTMKQKIGTSIRDIKQGIELLNRCLKMNVRLKNEMSVPSSELWKRTNNQFIKIEQQLLEMAARIREMRT